MFRAAYDLYIHIYGTAGGGITLHIRYTYDAGQFSSWVAYYMPREQCAESIASIHIDYVSGGYYLCNMRVMRICVHT